MKKFFVLIIIFSIYISFGSTNVFAVISNGTVASTQKIADNTGGFGTLADIDGFGAYLSSIGDLNNDGVTDLVVGSPGDDIAGTDRGAVYILFMNSNGTVASTQKIADNTGGFGTLVNSDFFGYSVSSIGDLNNDGITDIAVGAYNDDTGGLNRGAVYILFMNSNGTVASTQKIADNTGGFGTLINGDNFGYSVSSIGDLNNDGITDIAVGTYHDNTGGTDRGAVYILFMNSNGTVASTQKIADNTGGFGTLADIDGFGAYLSSIGDLNNDGVTDLVVGSPGDDIAGTDRGAVYILFMNSNGTVASTQKIADNTGGFGTLVNSDFFGYSVSSIGDLNNDGITDIAVGASGDDTGGLGRGSFYILFMNANGTVLSTQKIANNTGGFGTLVDSDNFGRGLSSIGDLNNDGITDIAVGAISDDTGGSGRGAVYILFMTSFSTTTNPISTTTETEATLNGTITDTGGSNITERGFNYGLTDSYGTNITETSGPYTTGTYSLNLTELTCETTYHYRAYATNSVGTDYGSDTTFTTNNCPVTSGSRPRPKTTISTPVVTQTETICPQGDKYSSTTGQPCTSFIPSTSSGQATPNTPTTCLITLTLRQGNTGEQVKCLQTKLNQSESLNLSLDGIFGPITKSAVILFQKNHGLVQDGIFGPKSRAVMQ